jgi:hypothetical protein
MSDNIFGDLVADMDDELAHLVKQELQTGWRAQQVMAAIEATRVKQLNDQIEHCTVEGLGQHVMDVPADAYFAWKRHLGDDCWADRGFRDWFKKHNPETAVNYTPRNTTILVP